MSEMVGIKMLHGIPAGVCDVCQQQVKMAVRVWIPRGGPEGMTLIACSPACVRAKIDVFDEQEQEQEKEEG